MFRVQKIHFCSIAIIVLLQKCFVCCGGQYGIRTHLNPLCRRMPSLYRANRPCCLRPGQPGAPTVIIVSYVQQPVNYLAGTTTLPLVPGQHWNPAGNDLPSLIASRHLLTKTFGSFLMDSDKTRLDSASAVAVFRV